MDELKEYLQERFGKFDPKDFLKRKILLLAALVCEIISLLIDKGMLDMKPEFEGRFLVAGVVLMFVWLVIDGLQRKYKKMAAVFEANMAADTSEEAVCSEETANE